MKTQLKKSLKIFKIGGNILDNNEALHQFLDKFCSLGGSKILIHGGGKEASRLAEKLEIPVTMIQGRRVTDAPTLQIVTMVYAGLVNKRVVAKLQERNCNAIGLSGADGNAIRANKRPPICIAGVDEPIDFGFVGDINSQSINVHFISSLLNSNIIPVFSAITHDGNGNLLNCNADSIASAIAIAMADVFDTELIYCFEQKGVLRDINNPESVIPRITAYNFQQLLNEAVIAKGMVPKLENALNAVTAGVKSVTIKHSDDILKTGGTIISNE